MARSASARTLTHQTVRLGVGRHDKPGDVVCVMELASMLAGERFTDRPSSVCPVIGAILRGYNDNIDERLRQDLYRYAAEAVGTRASFPLQCRRARVALAWAQAGYEQIAARWRGLRKPPLAPDPDWVPDDIAEYVIDSLGRRIGDEGHRAMIWLLDQLISMREPDERLAGELLGGDGVGDGFLVERAEQLPDPVEHRRGGEQIVVAELGQRLAPAGLIQHAALVDDRAAAIA